MNNEEAKNWNNFYLGLAVVVAALLGVPLVYKKLALVVLGLLIALFSLARPARLKRGETVIESLPNDYGREV